MNFYALSAMLLMMFNLASLNGANEKGKWTRESIVKSGKEEYDKYKGSVAAGMSLAIKECQTQFRYEKWNCSIPSTISKVPVFIKDKLPYATRETAFLHAISAAGVTYSLIRGCRLYHFKNCGCAKPKKLKKVIIAGESNTKSGCGDNYAFGAYVAKQFIDKLEKGSDSRTKLNLHNNEVGRKAVKSQRIKQCRCHGISGTCSAKACWMTLSPFQAIGNYLKKKYKNAKFSKYFNKQPGQKPSVAKRSKKDMDLLYMVSSPNYCVRNPKAGSTGMLGRECTGDQSICDNLCTSCKLVPKRVTVKKIVSCKCKFIWCCKVKCQECVTQVNKTTCTR